MSERELERERERLTIGQTDNVLAKFVNNE